MGKKSKVPQKILNILPYASAILLLGVYPEETKSYNLDDGCILMFIATLFIVTKTWRQPKYPFMKM